MLGLRPDRLCLRIGEGMADTRRSHASTRFGRSTIPYNWVGSRCRKRTRRAAEQLSSRIATDAMPTPVVVSSLAASNSLLNDDDADAAALAAPGIGDEGDPHQLTQEQLKSRRRSGWAASTSAVASNSSSSGSSFDGGDLLTMRRLGSDPMRPAAFPTFPRPRGAVGSPAAPTAAGPPAGPSPAAQVPPEAAQLYARSAVTGNLSAPVGSADVLVPLLDYLQLEPPVPSGPLAASNAQRVYTATVAPPTGAAASDSAAGAAAGGGAAAAGGAGAAGGTAGATALLQVRRRRARSRVLDASELLLARDEAVRTELIGRTWNDLLRFEERLSGTAAVSGVTMRGSDAAPRAAAGVQPQSAAATGTAAAAAAVTEGVAAAIQQQDVQQQDVQQELGRSSLDDVFSFLQEAAEALRDGHLAEEETEKWQLKRAAARSARLMSWVRGVRTWQNLARLYLKYGRSFSVPHLIATLGRLSQFWCDGRVGRGRGRRNAFLWVWNMLALRVAFAAPRMTGMQVVSVVNAFSRLPWRNSQRVEHSLLTVQRLLRHAQHTMQPAAPGGGAAGGGHRGRAAPNASDPAKKQRGDGGSLTVANSAAAIAVRGFGRPFEAEPDARSVAMGGPEYASLCYALGRLNVRARPAHLSLRIPTATGRRLLRGSYSQLAHLGPREFAGLLYGLACMRLCPPAPWLHGYYISSVRLFPAMTDVQLTMVAYGACRMRTKPPPPWIEAYLATVAARLRGLDGAGLAIAAHALGRMHYKPRPAWLEAFMAAAAEVLARGGMRVEEMSQLGRGLAFLGVQPPGDLLEALWDASGSAMERGEFKPAQLANLAWALGRFKVGVPKPWYNQLIVHMRRSHLRLRPYHRRRLLSALHAFGCRELPRWYQLMRIPLAEMPGYAIWMAVQAKQRSMTQHAQAATAAAAAAGGEQRETASKAAATPSAAAGPNAQAQAAGRGPVAASAAAAEGQQKQRRRRRGKARKVPSPAAALASDAGRGSA